MLYQFIYYRLDKNNGSNNWRPGVHLTQYNISSSVQ